MSGIGAMERVTFFVFALCIAVKDLVEGHGMMMDPVSRGSRWRVDSRAPVNYNDNQLFCGGFWVQWSVNNGRCGICGDNYEDPTPRAHEFGGLYGRGEPVTQYLSGSNIHVGVLITANHKGYFLFDLCDMDEHDKESEECFKQNRLKLANGDDRYFVRNNNPGWFNTTLVLPSDVRCSRCVLRWTYNTGNSWGVCADGTGKMGCGNQENFRGCSDVRINGSRMFRPIKVNDRIQKVRAPAPQLDEPNPVNVELPTAPGPAPGPVPMKCPQT